MTGLHNRERLQLLIGFLIGVIFGFFLQKGGVTYYNVILDQLLLRDFTVVKIILTAVMTAMVGIYLMRGVDLVHLSPKSFYLKGIVVGGLIFGVGFAILGYCPGTVAGAVGTGSVHALFGVVGVLIGTEIFSVVCPTMKTNLMEEDRGPITIHEVLEVNPWIVIFPVLIAFLLFLSYFEFI